MEYMPTKEQEALIESTIARKESALVIAGPGTGKSRTALEIARQRVRGLQADSQEEILFLSFSNAAIQRLSAAAGLTLTRQEKRRLTFLTYHSLAMQLLRSYGRFVGLPGKIRVADKLEEQLLALERQWPEMESDYQISTLGIARSDGVVVFDVLIPLATALLKGSPTLAAIVRRRYPLIVVDEFQDTSQGQWNLLREIGQDRQVVAFADPNQIIYSSLHAATKRRMEEFATWKGLTATPFSAKNFRCDRPTILNFADCLLQGNRFSSTNSNEVQLINLGFRKQRRVWLAAIWTSLRKAIEAASTIGFLAPSNKVAEEICMELRNPPPGAKLPFAIHARLARDEALEDAVKLALAALRDLASCQNAANISKAAVALNAMNAMWNRRIKSVREHLSKVLEIVASAVSDPSTPLGKLLQSLREGLPQQQQLSAFVSSISSYKEFKVTAGRLSSHDHLQVETGEVSGGQLSLFDNFRASRSVKGLYGEKILAGTTHVLTYHKAKGREFDCVVMLIDPREESTKPPLDEKRRLYYVSATRAKRWLGIIHFGKEAGSVLAPVTGH
jgi:superfamily I DNA/RNA helicase